MMGQMCQMRWEEGVVGEGCGGEEGRGGVLKLHLCGRIYTTGVLYR